MQICWETLIVIGHQLLVERKLLHRLTRADRGLPCASEEPCSEAPLDLQDSAAAPETILGEEAQQGQMRIVRGLSSAPRQSLCPGMRLGTPFDLSG